jgi:hypothetical protein
MYGRVHGDLFNVPQLLLPGVQLQIKFTKAKSDFYVLGTGEDNGAYFKFLDATLHVKPSPSSNWPTPRLSRRHNEGGSQDVHLWAGSKSVSIDNAVLGTLPKRILLAMLRNADFAGSPNSNPYYFRHFELNHFAMYVNGRQVPSEGITLDTSGIKTSTMAYQTLFSGLGIHHGNAGLQITPSQFMRGSFMLIFDLTPDGCASDGHTSLPDNCNIRIDVRFDEALAEAVTFVLYLEYDASIQIDKSRNVTTDF